MRRLRYRSAHLREVTLREAVVSVEDTGAAGVGAVGLEAIVGAVRQVQDKAGMVARIDRGQQVEEHDLVWAQDEEER